CITEDLQHNIWFGTFEGGVCKYDGQKVIPINLDTSEFKSVFKILFNPDGSLFIVSGRQHLFFLESINSSPDKIETIDSYNISPYERGKYVVGGAYGLYNLSRNGKN